LHKVIEMLEEIKKLEEEEKTGIEDIISYSEETEFLAMVDNALQKTKHIPVIDVSNSELKNNGIAFTDNKSIYLNFKEIKSMLNSDSYDEFLLLLKALNYHELCHNLYTKYNARKIDKSLTLVMNILEDQRVENLFFHTYKKTKYYFSNMYNETMIKNITKESSKMLYLLMYGRRFILDNKKIMKMIKDEFIKNETINDKIPQLEEIIDEYLITTNVAKQIELGKKFLSLLTISNLMGMDKLVDKDVYNTENSKAISANENSATHKVKVSIDNEIKQTTKKEKKNEFEQIVNTHEKIINAMKSESIKTQNKISKDNKNMKNIMKKEGFGIGKNKESERKDKHPRDYNFLPTDINNIQLKRIENTIKRLRIDIDNKTLYKQKKGKISMRNAMMNRSYLLNDFKEHIPSIRNKVNLDVTLLLDSSGSVHNDSFNVALKTAWTISKTIENTNGKSRILEFSNDYAVIKERHEKTENALWGRRFRGGTQPALALENIYTDLKNNERENKALFLLTDGGYDDFERVHTTIKKIRDIGVFVVFIFVGHTEYYIRRCKENYDKYVNVNDFSKLPKAMSEIVFGLQERSIKKH